MLVAGVGVTLALAGCATPPAADPSPDPTPAPTTEPTPAVTGETAEVEGRLVAVTSMGDRDAWALQGADGTLFAVNVLGTVRPTAGCVVVVVPEGLDVPADPGERFAAFRDYAETHEATIDVVRGC